MKAKEYLLSHGKIAAIGRGRISLDNHAFLQKAYESGQRFTDWPKGEVIKTDETVRVKRDPVQSNEKLVQEFTVLYDLDFYRAVASDGRTFTLREVCNNCRVSMVQCHCGSPTILGGIAVKIVPA